MASSLFHPSDPAAASQDYKGFILDPKRLLATCGFELHSLGIGGDVLLDLELGRIPVRSDVLSCASPVFKAMLGPNFSEGQALRSTINPKIITLEDDDIESMTILCILLHKDLSTVHLNTSEKLAETADPTRVFGVAVLADKYALVDHLENDLGLSLLAPFIRKHEGRKLDVSQALHLVAAAYLLQQAELFSLFARRLAIDYGDYSSLLDFTELFDHVPAVSICKLQVQCRLTHDFRTDHRQFTSRTNTTSYGHVSTQLSTMYQPEHATCAAPRSTTPTSPTQSPNASNPRRTTGRRTTLRSTLFATLLLRSVPCPNTPPSKTTSTLCAQGIGTRATPRPSSSKHQRRRSASLPRYYATLAQERTSTMPCASTKRSYGSA